MYRLLISRNGSTGFVVGTLDELRRLVAQPGVTIVPNPYNPKLN